jgi:hypothetical protein
LSRSQAVSVRSDLLNVHASFRPGQAPCCGNWFCLSTVVPGQARPGLVVSPSGSIVSGCAVSIALRLSGSTVLTGQARPGSTVSGQA